MRADLCDRPDRVSPFFPFTSRMLLECHTFEGRSQLLVQLNRVPQEIFVRELSLQAVWIDQPLAMSVSKVVLVLMTMLVAGDSKRSPIRTS